MLGSSITAKWHELRPRDELITVTRADVDLRSAPETRAVIDRAQPDAIVHAAARVAGIADKLSRPTDFLLQNLQIDASVIGGAIDARVPELLYISSGAIYPADIRQPLVESDVLTGRLEPANEGYALAKIAGGRLCSYASSQHGLTYRVAVPSNLYSPDDDFSPGRSHLVASTIAKVHQANTVGGPVEVWGDGTARREFTFAPELAAWLVGQIGRLGAWPEMLNLGSGFDHSIADYYRAAARVVGYSGEFRFDPTKPAGVHQRLLDSSAAQTLGWNPVVTLDAGYAASYQGYLRAITKERQRS